MYEDDLFATRPIEYHKYYVQCNLDTNIVICT